MSLTVQEVDVYLEEHGAGEPVLFLHDVPDSAQMWEGVIEHLESQYRCLATDLPDLGRSVAPANFACRLPHMASFIEDLVRALDLPLPLNLVVTDFGATYGLAWAVTHPEKVRKLAIVGGVNFFSDYRWHSNARLLRMPVLGELGMATMTRASFIKTMAPTAPRLPPEHFGEVYDLSLSRRSVRRMVLRLYRYITPSNFVGWEDRLLAFTSKVPTMVLWGDQDPFISSAYAERFGAERVEHFPNNGHWLAIEAPAEVAERLATFLTAADNECCE